MARDITDQEILQNIRAAQGELILKLLRENRSLERKARALDKILAERGMTWEEYQTGTDAPAHGREPNEHSEETRVNTGEGSQTR